MSSLRVRATNKFLSKLGAVKPSKNLQFELAHNGFDQLQTGVVNLDSALQGFIVALKAFHSSSNVLLRAVEDVSNFRCTDSPSDAPEVKQFIEVFKACTLHIDVVKFTELVKQFETRVQKPSQGWMHQVETLKAEVHDFHETHITFDHYTKKVQGLRDAHNKRAGMGKQEKSKDVDKLVRNEQKLVTITNDYQKTADTTIQHLRTFTQQRDATLLPLVQRIIEFRVNYSKEIHDATVKMDPLLQISSYDEHMAVLESFAPSGHGAAPAPPKRVSEARQEPDVQVQTLSFSDFVGTDAPAAPTQAPAPPSHDFFSPSAPAPQNSTNASTKPPATTESWQDFGAAPAQSQSFEAFGATPATQSQSFEAFGATPAAGTTRTTSGHINAGAVTGGYGSNSGRGSGNTTVLGASRTASGKEFMMTAPPTTSASTDFNPFASSPPPTSFDANPFAAPPANPTPAYHNTQPAPNAADPFGFMGQQ